MVYALYEGRGNRQAFIDHVRQTIDLARRHSAGTVTLVPSVRETHHGICEYELTLCVLDAGRFLASYVTDRYAADMGHNANDSMTRHKMEMIGDAVIEGLRGVKAEFSDDGVLFFE